MTGLLAIVYGYNGYINVLPSSAEALNTFILFIGYGVFGFLVYPVSLIYDMLPSKTKSPTLANIILIIFFIVVFLSMVASAYGGLTAVGAHIARAP